MKKLLAAGIGIVGFCQILNAQPVKGLSKPNIIYIIADQLRYDMLGFSGDYKVKTPNIDRLAGQSINFRNCISATPVCAPYRASLFTGKFSWGTGMVTNEVRINPNQASIATVPNAVRM